MDKELYRFGPFELDPAEQRLTRDGRAIALAPKAFQTLLVLVRHAGRLVEKDDLLRAVWPNTSVEEIGLTRNISVLRKALGDDPDGGSWIETVPTRGYRFAATRESTDPVSIVARRRLWTWPRLVTAAAVAATAILAWGLAGRPRASAFPSHVHAIAVLPLRTSGSAADESLGAGVAEALTRRISSLGRLEVRPTSAVLSAAAANTDLRSLGKRLRADAILTGTIERSNSHVRASIQIVDASSGGVVWAHAIDDAAGDVFALEDSISTGVADALLLTLTSAERGRLARRDTRSPEAYAAYVRGRFQLNRRSRESLGKSVEEFRRAIAIDPTYALAYAGLADAYVVGAHLIVPGDEGYRLADAAARKALELDDTIADAHAAMGFTAIFEWNWATAGQELRRAVALDRNSAPIRYDLGVYHEFVGDLNGAVAEMTRAVELDPMSTHYATRLSFYLIDSGRIEEGIRRCRDVLSIDPANAAAHYALSDAYERQGRLETAIQEARAALDLDGDNYEYIEQLATLYGHAGDMAHAAEMLRRLETLKPPPPLSALPFAAVRLAMGDRNRALEGVEQAYRNRDERLVSLKTDPHFDALHGDPRFDAVLKKIGLNP